MCWGAGWGYSVHTHEDTREQLEGVSSLHYTRPRDFSGYQVWRQCLDLRLSHLPRPLVGFEAYSGVILLDWEHCCHASSLCTRMPISSLWSRYSPRWCRSRYGLFLFQDSLLLRSEDTLLMLNMTLEAWHCFFPLSCIPIRDMMVLFYFPHVTGSPGPVLQLTDSFFGCVWTTA